MKKKAFFETTQDGLSSAVEFVQHSLEEIGITSKEAIKGTLVSEEAIGSLISHCDGETNLSITVNHLFGDITVEMSTSGTEYSLSDDMASASLSMDDDIGPQTQETIQNIFLRSLAKDLKYRHRNGVNYIRVTLVKSKQAFLYKTISCLLGAILIGVLLSIFAPQSFNDILDDYILSPVKTVYINILKMIVAPLVFFSIVSCISGFSNLSDLGKIGGRSIGLYFFTTLVAVAIGIFSFYLFKPGSEALSSAVTATAAKGAGASFSIKEMLINMAPSNFIKPFLNDDMPQLIVLAVLCGIATGLIGQYSSVLQSIFRSFNEMFMKIAGILIGFMPIAVFCSAASMILDLGVQTLISIMNMFATFLFGLVCMMVVYCILIIVLGRLSPIPFIRKYSPVMLQVFSIASSNAAIPINMSFCESKLGVDSKVYSLSIPLGSTLNMNGTCIQLAVFALALAKVYGVPVSGESLITMAILTIILSMGAPGMPGGGVICLSVLLEQLHVPTEAVTLVMGIGPILGMFLCMSNCLGDVVVATIVARQTNKLDLETYKSM
ncbi:MAG: dicarboxylate/amino acid:cation symporter [Spirochaetales bacterium]|nr:dicarboxylate/amino acid:cation symporter [Spirochaetales bacterium]